jgi:hypothetical protein
MPPRFRLAWVVVSLVGAACATSPASTVTVVEIPPPPPETAPPPRVAVPIAVAARAEPRVDCEHPPHLVGCVTIARVRAGALRLSSSSCYVESIVRTGDVGRLQRCANGAALVFDKGTFAGNLDGTHFEGCTSTRFPFSDGCTWQTKQRVDGDAFEYSEAPIDGTSCAPSSCRASATLTTQP